MEGFRCWEAESVASVVERLKSFAKSGEEFVRGTLQRLTNELPARRRNRPIEILKRLQREAFSEVVKLRERQDKFERVLSYQTSKGSHFQEEHTHMRGVVDVFGALSFVGNDSQQTFDLSRTGVRTRIDSRFIFETVARQKDSLLAEFVASEDSLGYHGDVHMSSLSLSKVMYTAYIMDWLSLISIPLGARCKDFGSSSHTVQVLTGISSSVPPLLHESHGFAAGLRTKGSYFGASVAVLVSGLGMQPFSVTRTCLSTFGQIDYEPFVGTKLTFLGMRAMSESSSQQIGMGNLTVPSGSVTQHGIFETLVQQPNLGTTRNKTDNVSSGSIALMLESELDESSRVGGWVQLQKSSLKNLRWALSLSDTPEDEVGWGLSVGSTIEDRISQVKLEGFLKFNLGNKFILQPGVAYVMDERTQFPALMLHSSWTL